MGYALVTGATSGIGREFASILAQHGKDVIVVARRENALKALAAQLHEQHGVHAVAVAIDLTEEDSADELFSLTQDAG